MEVSPEELKAVTNINRTLLDEYKKHGYVGKCKDLCICVTIDKDNNHD